MKEVITENLAPLLAGPEAPTPPAMAAEIVVSRPPPPRPPAKSRKPSAYLLLVVFLLVGGGCGYYGMRFGKALLVPIPGPKWLLLLAAGGLPLLWLISVGFHEFGHIVGGWLMGGKFLLWLAGPLMVRRTPAGIRASWNRLSPWSGGLSACIPLNPLLMTPRRTAVMILGGPLASLGLAFGSLWLAGSLAAWGPPSRLTAILQNMAVFNALTSFLILLATAAPSASGGFKSDGKRVLELLRGDARSEQESALLALTAANLAGIRPAEYEPALVAKAVSLNDGSLFDLYGHITVYYHAADRGQWVAAQAHLDHALGGEDKVTPFARDIVRCEYAWLLAWQTSEAATARAWLDSAGKLEFDPATRLRAEAAVLLAEGKKAESAAKARQGLHALRTKSLSPVESPFAVQALEHIIGRAEQSCPR